MHMHKRWATKKVAATQQQQQQQQQHHQQQHPLTAAAKVAAGVSHSVTIINALCVSETKGK